MPRHVPVSPSCVKCRLRAPACACEFAPCLDVQTRVVIVMHRIEWHKPSNTGHLARLALRDCEIRIHGLPHQSVRSDDVDPASALALFPGRGAELLTRDVLSRIPRPITLLVPDGNWNQSRHMMKRVPMLRDARAVRIADDPLDVRRLRHNVDPERRSTFEALAHALRAIEGDEVGRRMLEFFSHVLATKDDRD